MMRPVALVLLGMGLVVTGCAGPSRGPGSPYAPLEESRRDTAAAMKLSQEASAVSSSDPAQAELLLRAALTADLFHGPAHNNLGVLYLKQGKLYEAASEFEWARKLMPGHPDPRLNLALTLERAGQVDEAIAAYQTALEVQPGYVAAMQGLASLYYRTGRGEEQRASLLREIAMRGDSAEWREWAQERLASVR